MLDPSFFSYVTIMSITPGPNNLLLATAGVNYGLRRTLPMMFGIALGCAVQCLLCSALLHVLLEWIGAVRLPLTVAGCLYLFWLSWLILRADAPSGRGAGRPMTLLGGALFQAVNPKAWLMATNVALLYSTRGDPTLQAMLIAGAFIVLNLPCVFLWAALGDRLRHSLQVRWKLRAFNATMALSLAATALWMLAEIWTAR